LFRVAVEAHFRASHQLTLPEGTKEGLHRHDWLVTAEVSSNRLNSMGLVIDFHRLKAMVDNIIGELDNKVLEGISYFQTNNSSAENVARYIYEKLEPKLPKSVILEYVKVVEEPGYSAKYAK